MWRQQRVDHSEAGLDINIQAMSQVASGAASLVGVGLLVVFGVGWLVAPLIGWMKGMPTFAAGWSASGVVLAVGVLLRLLTTGTP